MFESIITVIHVLVSIFIILVVLLQAGKGGGVSAAFGGGAGAALGQRAAATVLGKITVVCAVLFMTTSMTLAKLSTPDADDPLKALAAEQETADAEKKSADKEAKKAAEEATKNAGKKPAEGEEKPAEGGE